MLSGGISVRRDGPSHFWGDNVLIKQQFVLRQQDLTGANHLFSPQHFIHMRNIFRIIMCSKGWVTKTTYVMPAGGQTLWNVGNKQMTK